MRPSSLKWTTTMLLAALCAALSACDRSPTPAVDDTPPELAATRPAATEPIVKSNIELGDPLPSMRARAEGGDIGAMVSLGRAYESLGSAANKIEARKWYEKAAKLGDSSAKESLAMMDAAAAPPKDGAPLRIGSTTGPSTEPVARSSSGPVNLDKLSWQEILNCFDNKDFATVAQPNFRPKPTDPLMFLGLTTSPDKTMTAAVSGAESGDINAVSVVLRVRNRQDLATNKRIQQAATIASTVTRGNVSQNEFVDWVTKYLMSGVKSEPLFRNGWRISVSGTAGEGVQDPKKYLGEAVLIEMKK
jgi:hypothetical protein